MPVCPASSQFLDSRFLVKPRLLLRGQLVRLQRVLLLEGFLAPVGALGLVGDGYFALDRLKHLPSLVLLLLRRLHLRQWNRLDVGGNPLVAKS